MVEPKIEVAGLSINPFHKAQLLEVIAQRMASGRQTFLTTVYSEFLYHALRDRHVMLLLNSADISIADGVGIVWADYFLSRPVAKTQFHLRILQAWWQVIYTGAAILLRPRQLYSNRIPEKIVGADLIWDLAELAHNQGYSIFLLGGRGEVAQVTAHKLQARFPGLKIAGTSSKDWNDVTVLEDIRKTSADMLFVAFNPRIQEQWIAKHLPHLPARFAVGLGGTFDYLSGTKSPPPKWLRDIGLEWLYRLLTQPKRLPRIINAVFGLTLALVRYKVFMSYPLRENALAVVINSENKILLCRRNPHRKAPNGWLLEPNKEYWQFPQGGMDVGETPEQAGARELREETGITSVELLHVKLNSNYYYWSNAIKKLLTAKYKNSGQSQHAIFFRFIGKDAEISLDEREIDAYRWCEVADLDKVVAKEIQAHAQAIQAELGQLNLE